MLAPRFMARVVAGAMGVAGLETRSGSRGQRLGTGRVQKQLLLSRSTRTSSRSGMQVPRFMARVGVAVGLVAPVKKKAALVLVRIFERVPDMVEEFSEKVCYASMIVIQTKKTC